MKGIVLATVIAGFSLVCHADMFKCQVNGRTIYQQQPCAAGTHKGTIAARKEVTDSEARATRGEFEERQAARTLADRMKVIDRLIREKTKNIEEFRWAMETELDALHAKKESAFNNLAGATYQLSISTEMQAVTTKYSAKIKIAQDEIDALRKEKASLTE